MEALILSCGMGGGHNAAGNALKEELERQGHHASMLNPYTLYSRRLAAGIDGAYISLAQKAPNAFGMVYAAGEAYRRLPFRSPVYYENRRMAAVMADFLAEHHFDVVLMPHIFPAEILTYMKLHHMSVPKTVFVATDYTCIPFTEECECDAYVIPHPELADSFISRGIPADRIYACGIPVSRGFCEPVSCEEASRLLGLEHDKKYILISGGGIGAGKIEKILELLYEEMGQEERIRLTVICGSNQRLYERLQQKYGEHIILIGHTDQMALYLRASSLFITKPGGLSSTEAAVMGVPLIHVSPIPGCETYNACFFEKHGMSRRIQPSKSSMGVVRACMEDEAVRSELLRNQRKWIRADAASEICALAYRMVTEGDCEGNIRSGGNLYQDIIGGV